MMFIPMNSCLLAVPNDPLSLLEHMRKEDPNPWYIDNQNDPKRGTILRSHLACERNCAVDEPALASDAKGV